MRIIDCILYGGEPIALFRLDYLWDVVDEFVIVEAGETHSGKRKDLYLDKNATMFKPYEAKIKRLIIDRFPDPSQEDLALLVNHGYKENTRSWFRETYQRNFPGAYLRDLGAAIFLCCDADEIPRRELIEGLRNQYEDLNEPKKLEMLLFCYSSRWIKRSKWNRAFVVNDRSINSASIDDLRTSTSNRKYIANAGWHLSYFMTEQEMARKMESFCDADLNTKENSNPDWLRHCKETGVDLFHRGRRQDCLPYTGDDLPQNLRVYELTHIQDRLRSLTRPGFFEYLPSTNHGLIS